MERDHRAPADIRPGGPNHLLRNEFLPHEREGGLQCDPPEQTALRAQSLRRSTRSLSELGRDKLQRERRLFQLPGAYPGSYPKVVTWIVLPGELHLGP